MVGGGGRGPRVSREGEREGETRSVIVRRKANAIAALCRRRHHHIVSLHALIAPRLRMNSMRRLPPMGLDGGCVKIARLNPLNQAPLPRSRSSFSTAAAAAGAMSKQYPRGHFLFVIETRVTQSASRASLSLAFFFWPPPLPTTAMMPPPPPPLPPKQQQL